MATALRSVTDRLPQDLLIPQLPDRRGDPLNLFALRIRSGTDLIILFQADWGSRRVECIAKSTFAGVNPGEERRIGAILAALQAVSLEDWAVFHHRTKLQQDPVVFDRISLVTELTRRLGQPDDVPHSGAIGWLRDDAEGRPLFFYFAAWLAGGYEVRYQLNGAVMLLIDAAFRWPNASDSEFIGHLVEGERGFIFDQPVAGENGGIIKELSAAGECYPLRSHLYWMFDPDSRELHVEGLSPAYVGGGGSKDEAWADFSRQFHSDFQALHRTRPFNRDEQQDRVWRHLFRFVDVGAYRDRMPRRLRRIGKVARVCEDRYVVAWVYERKAEWVRLDRAPKEFRHLEPGTWFEAQLDYDPRTRELLRMVHVRADNSLEVDIEPTAKSSEDEPEPAI